MKKRDFRFKLIQTQVVAVSRIRVDPPPQKSPRTLLTPLPALLSAVAEQISSQHDGGLSGQCRGADGPQTDPRRVFHPHFYPFFSICPSGVTLPTLTVEAQLLGEL